MFGSTRRRTLGGALNFISVKFLQHRLGSAPTSVGRGSYFAGSSFTFGQSVSVGRSCEFYADYGAKIIVGKSVSFNSFCHINASGGGVIRIEND